MASILDAPMGRLEAVLGLVGLGVLALKKLERLRVVIARIDF